MKNENHSANPTPTSETSAKERHRELNQNQQPDSSLVQKYIITTRNTITFTLHVVNGPDCV